jgi:hypothetical protein
MKRLSALFAAASVAALAFLSTSVFAGDDAPSAPADAPKAAPVDAPKPAAPATTEAPKADTKTPSPIATMMMWVGKQVMPNLANACPSTAEGEKAWRGWFTGGADVPLAGLRDAMVADGWSADKFVTFFQAMAKASSEGCHDGKCHDGEGKCHAGDGKCGGKCAGDGAGGKCEGGKCEGGKCEGGCPCKGAKDAKPATDATPKADPAKPVESPAKP